MSQAFDLSAAQGAALPAAEAPAKKGSAARLGALAALVVAAVVLVLSIFQSYWNITLLAPQYPKGLHVRVFVNKLEGVPETIEEDVREVDGLNHYIGMMKLSDAAPLERKISIPAIIITALLTVASFWFTGVWRFIARIPIIMYPVIFVVDLFCWLYYAGHSLDPHAPLSSSIKPFTPHMIGSGKIGQFGTEAAFGVGFWLAVIASALTVIALVLDRKASRNAAA